VGYSIDVSILIPLLGTKLFERMEKEGRILTKDWSRYDLYHVVFKPKLMTTEELYYGTVDFIKEFYSRSNTMKVFINNIKKLGLISSSYINYHLLTSGRLYRKYFCFSLK